MIRTLAAGIWRPLHRSIRKCCSPGPLRELRESELASDHEDRSPPHTLAPYATSVFTRVGVEGRNMVYLVLCERD